MRLNPRVLAERTDMFSELQIPTCPTTKIAGYSLRTACEHIINLLAKPGYAFPDYNKMTELDNILVLVYWREFDGFSTSTFLDFDNWFIYKATPIETLRRAREWLASHNYVLIKADVQLHALRAGDNTRNAIRR